MYEYRIVNTDEEKKLIYELRYDVYCKEKKWLDSSNYPECLENDKYDKNSIHFGAFDVNNTLVGSVRLILPTNELPLPIEGTFEIDLAPNQKRFEISRLVIPQDRRGFTVFNGLIEALYYWGVENKITHVYAILENGLLKYTRRKCLPFNPMKEGKDYFGAFTIPVCLIVSELGAYLAKYNITDKHNK